MGRKAKRLKSRLAAAQRTETLLKARCEAVDKEAQRYYTQLNNVRNNANHAGQRYLAELARYKFIDSAIEAALREMPGHPILQYMRNERQMLQYPSPFLDMPHIEALAAWRPPTGPEESCNYKIDILRYFLFDAYSDVRGSHFYPDMQKIGIRAEYNGQAIAYILPDSIKRLTPKQQFDVVVRELAPAVIDMLTKANNHG